jgi:hypothetical protein
MLQHQPNRTELRPMDSYVRDAGGGGQGGGACAPPQVLGYQLTLFGPRRADYARHITSAPHLFGRCGVSVMYIQILCI